MSISVEHPFVPGARVAIRYGYSDHDYRESFVEKVHKTGHFTLVGGRGQRWRPSSPGHMDSGRWRAYQTGQDRWSREVLLLWDEHTDAEISTAIAATERKSKWYDLRKRIEALHHNSVTDEMIAQIELALTATQEKSDG